MSRILVIDDEAINLTVAKRVLEKRYEVDVADSGMVALDYLEENTPDLILLDINMPVMSGFQVMEAIHGRPEWEKIPVIILTADVNVDTEVKCFELGAVDYISKPFYHSSMLKRVEKVLELQSLKNELEKQVAEKTRELEYVTLQSLTAFAGAIDSKDEYTRGHSIRVSKYAAETARELGWNEDEVRGLRYAAILHDIGRVGVPDSILNKQGKLEPDEYELIKKHTQIGNEMLKDLTLVKDVAMGAKYHHERYDGTGYPEGLSGMNIPAAARLIAIADAYDAMRNPRPYRGELTKEEIRAELERQSGIQFDPGMLQAFVRLWDNGGLDYIEKSDEAENDESDSSRLLLRIMEKQNENFRESSERDCLTSLYNRRFAEQTIAKELRGGEGTFFLMDIDNFKYINDVFGHMTGDAVLKITAEILSAHAGEKDVVFRLGGDEYGIFVPGICTIEGAEKYANELIFAYKQRQKDTPFMKKSSLSIGAAISNYDGKTFEELYNKADKALYFVKQNGRNSFYCYSISDEEKKTLSALGRKSELQRFADMLLKYDEKTGVFEVGYREFENVFELASRFTKRNDQKMQLILFTLLPLDDDMKDAMLQEDIMTLLEEAIHDSLRRVDISVRFSSSQYLVALVDTQTRYVDVVTDRITQSFYMLYSGRDFVLDYDVAHIERN